MHDTTSNHFRKNCLEGLLGAVKSNFNSASCNASLHKTDIVMTGPKYEVMLVVELSCCSVKLFLTYIHKFREICFKHLAEDHTDKLS